jgi:uncharacterized membrane protein YhaH (DUF805 family)
VIGWIATLVLIAVGLLLFVLPHHDDPATGVKTSYYSTLAELAESIHSDEPLTERAFIVQFLFAIACVAVFFPALLSLVANLASMDKRRPVLILGGIALIVGAVMMLFMALLADLSIGFGSSQTKYTGTIVTILAPAITGACGVSAIIMGAMRLTAW